MSKTKENTKMKTALNPQPPKLNALQVSLLRLFNHKMTEKQALSLKQVLIQDYDSLLKAELEKVINEKDYTQTDFDKMFND